VRPGILAAVAAGILVFGLSVIGGIGAVGIAIVLLALVVVGFAKPEIATVTVVFVIYGDLAAVAVRSHGVPAIAAISFFALLVLPVAYYLVGRGERLRTDTVLLLMLVYLAVQVASAVFARNVAGSLHTIASFVTEGVAIYFLLLNAIRTPETLRRCLWAILAAGVLLGSASLVQNRTKHYDRDFGGLALTRSSMTNEESVIATDDNTDKPDTRPRALGPIGDGNFYAQIMVVLLPIATLRFWAERKRRARWLGIATLVPIFGAVVLTFSRGAALAAMFFCVMLLALRYMKPRHTVIPVIVALIVVALTPDYAARVLTLLKVRSPEMRSADASIQERSTIYLSGIHIFLDHPLLGVGIGQAPEYLAEYSNYSGHSRLARKMGAHNMYLESLAETGILGFGALMAIVGVTLRRLWQLRGYWKTRNPEYAHNTTSLMLAILVFLVTGLFLHLAYARYFWLLLALAGAACMVYRPEEKRALEVSTVARPRTRAAVLLRPY
jgi:hypothetical protein